MPDFKDTFNRANAAQLWNGWRYINRSELAGAAAPKAWKVVSNQARSGDANLTQTLAYKAWLTSKANPYKVTWKFRGPVGATGANAAEAFFRMTTVTGLGRRRFAIVLNGATGSLRERRTGPTAGDSTDTVIATWPRIDDNEFDITVLVSGEVINLYDTNYEGPDNRAVIDLVSTFNINNSGIGVGSGYLDEFAIDDVESFTSEEFEFAPIQLRVTADVELAADKDEVEEEPLWQTLAVAEPEPYIVRDGIPTALPVGLHAGAVSSVDGVVVDTSGLLPAADIVNTGADSRFIASAATVNHTSNPGKWMPSVGDPARYWTLLNNFTATELAKRPAPKDPALAIAYSYSTALGRLVRPAVSFNTRGFMQLQYPLPALPTDPPDPATFLAGPDAAPVVWAASATARYVNFTVGYDRLLEYVLVHDVDSGEDRFYLPKGHPFYPGGGWFPGPSKTMASGVSLDWVDSLNQPSSRRPTWHAGYSSTSWRLRLLPALAFTGTLQVTVFTSDATPLRAFRGTYFRRPRRETSVGQAVCVVAVLHPGTGAKYSVVHTDQSKRQVDYGVPLSLDYERGRFAAHAGAVQVGFDAPVVPSGATVMFLNLDLGADRGTLFVQGRSRVHRDFSLANVDALGDGMWFGATMAFLDGFRSTVAADMDVFEIGLYDRAVRSAERLRIVNKLCAVYGIAR